MGMGQYLLIPFLVGWTSIYQLFWCELQGYMVLTHSHISFCMFPIDLSFPVGRSSLLAPMDGLSEEGFSKGESSQVGWRVSEVSSFQFHHFGGFFTSKCRKKPWKNRLQWSLECTITSSNPDKSEFFKMISPHFFPTKNLGHGDFVRQVAIPWRPWMRTMGFCQSYGLFGSVEQAGYGIFSVGIGELELGSTLIRDFIYEYIYIYLSI